MFIDRNNWFDNKEIIDGYEKYFFTSHSGKEKSKYVIKLHFMTNPLRQYTYLTSIPLQVGHYYTIVADNSINYNNSPVIIDSRNPYNNQKFNFVPRIITEACQWTVSTSAMNVKSADKRPDSGIKQVIFNEEKRTTVVLWKDGMKTKVVCSPQDTFDKEKALALCYMKRAFGNKGCFNETLKRYCY